MWSLSEESQSESEPEPQGDGRERRRSHQQGLGHNFGEGASRASLERAGSSTLDQHQLHDQLRLSGAASGGHVQGAVGLG